MLYVFIFIELLIEIIVIYLFVVNFIENIDVIVFLSIVNISYEFLLMEFIIDNLEMLCKYINDLI